MHGFSFPFHVDEVVFLANIFKVCFSHNLPFDQKDACVSYIMMANLGRLANLIRICGFLIQTKAYWFWHEMQAMCLRAAAERLNIEQIDGARGSAWLSFVL